jgi:hypothetical protein
MQTTGWLLFRITIKRLLRLVFVLKQEQKPTVLSQVMEQKGTVLVQKFQTLFVQQLEESVYGLVHDVLLVVQ